MNQSELEAKTSNQYQARENIQPVPSAGKQATSAKSGENAFDFCSIFVLIG